MTTFAIRAEGLGKKYSIGRKRADRYRTFREAIMGRVKGGRPGAEEDFWALRNVDFEIAHGEVVGVIGRNGAGKSTLLKIISRITEPTEGRVAIHGRVGSLLEVGTGFHPELTGRENVYLNGAILGMTRSEIRATFDAIVAFADVESFLDTPVKRYSTGMQVRLAFSVAVHLDPEILVVDEVLAVGDVQFQKRCLGRIGEITREGRTVLFVSHNLHSVQSLCTRAMLLDKGHLVDSGPPAPIVSRYLSMGAHEGAEAHWVPGEAPGTDACRLLSVEVRNAAGALSADHRSSDDVWVTVTFSVTAPSDDLCVGFDLVTHSGAPVFRTFQTDMADGAGPRLRRGVNRWTCRIPKGLLNAGGYAVCPRMGIHNRHWIVCAEPVVRFQVTLDHSASRFWTGLAPEAKPGVVAPVLDWNESPYADRPSLPPDPPAPSSPAP